MVLVQDSIEIPFGDVMYLDFETTSGDDKLDSINPWHHCKILGIAVSFDDRPEVYYIPLRHRGDYQVLKNVDIEAAKAWLKDAFAHAHAWINHNIKYDMHVAKNDFGLEFHGRVIDTVTMAKLAPREERFSYRLDELMREWLQTDITPYEHIIKQYIKKDYATCPIDYMAEYACCDVESTRTLYKWLKANIVSPEVVDMEQRLTPVLFNIEQRGMRVDITKVRDDFFDIPGELEEMTAKLSKMTGIREFRAHVSADLKHYFIDKLNLPVMLWTNEEDESEDAVHNPSFGKEAIAMYRGLAPDDVLDAIKEYSKLYKLYSGFTKPYNELMVRYRVHPNYTQAKRTGRMACSEPNMQQLSKRAKSYILAEKGRILVDFDYSQIEFRMIVHYTQDARCIKAYRDNPLTDYHNWVASECRIDRSPAKTMNFLLGYGGGKKRAVKALRALLGAQADDVALAMYDTYHASLPNLKPTMLEAAKTVRLRGYVKTLMGRRRYFPKFIIDKTGKKRDPSYKAFNTASQGSAADFMKYATLNLVDYLKDKDIHLLGIIHDSWVLDCPEDADLQAIANLLAVPPVQLRVPIVCNYKTSKTSWAECG